MIISNILFLYSSFKAIMRALGLHGLNKHNQLASVSLRHMKEKASLGSLLDRFFMS